MPAFARDFILWHLKDWVDEQNLKEVKQFARELKRNPLPPDDCKLPAYKTPATPAQVYSKAKRRTP